MILEAAGEINTGDDVRDGELEELRSLVYQEKGHGQWKKQLMNLFCLTLIIIMSLLRGGKSDFGFEKCSAGDWSSVAIFAVLMVFVIYMAVRLVAYE